MAGIINSAVQNAALPSPSPAASSGMGDPLLQKTKTGVETKVSPAIRQQFLRIENAGLALITQGDMPQRVLQKIQGNPDVADAVSDGVANTLALVYNEVSSKMPAAQKKDFDTSFLAAAPTASIAIMCQVLDMAEQALKIKVTPDLIAQCTQQTTTKVLLKLHVSQDQIQQAINAGRQKKGA